MAVPSYLVGATTHQWLNVSDEASSNLLTAAMSGIDAAYPGSGDVQAMVEAWSSGLVITRPNGGQYVVLHSGGHGDGAWNGLAIFGPLNSDSPAWSIIPDSYSDVGDVTANAARNADGRPNANHGYGNLVYLAGLDLLVRCGASALYGGSANPSLTFDAWDFANEEWIQFDDSPLSGRNAQYMVAVEGPSDTIYYGFGHNLFFRVVQFDPTAGTGSQHTMLGADPWSPFQPSGTHVYDATRNLLLWYDTSAGWCSFEPGTSSVPANESLSGDTLPSDVGRSGMLYEPDTDLIMLYRGASGATTSLFSIDPDTFVVDEIVPGGGDTPVRGSNTGEGVYGRFGRVSNADYTGYVLFMDYDGDVFFYPTEIAAAGGETGDTSEGAEAAVTCSAVVNAAGSRSEGASAAMAATAQAVAQASCAEDAQSAVSITGVLSQLATLLAAASSGVVAQANAAASATRTEPATASALHQAVAMALSALSVGAQSGESWSGVVAALGSLTLLASADVTQQSIAAAIANALAAAESAAQQTSETAGQQSASLSVGASAFVALLGVARAVVAQTDTANAGAVLDAASTIRVALSAESEAGSSFAAAVAAIAALSADASAQTVQSALAHALASMTMPSSASASMNFVSAIGYLRGIVTLIAALDAALTLAPALDGSATLQPDVE